MKLFPIGSNQTEVTIGNTTVLFSYKTHVAARTPEGEYKTDHRWSVTTSKHISVWGGKNWPTKPQAWFDGLCEGGAK